MNNLEVLEVQITAILSTVTELVRVYDYEPLEIFDLPAASIFYSGFGSEDQSIPRTLEVSENWILRLYIRLDDAEKAQDEMKKIMPQIREAFRKNRDLNGRCLYTTLSRGDVFAVMDKNNAQLVAELHLSAITEERD